MRPNKKVAIVQRLIPHYRIDLFKFICEQAGADVTVYHSTAVSTDGLVESGTFDFPNVKVKMTDWRFFCYQRLVRELITSDYDLIVLGPELRIISNTLVWLGALFKRTRVVWWTHGFNVHTKGKGLMFAFDRAVKSLMMKFSHKIMLYNDYRVKELVGWGIDPDKLIVLNNTINEKPHQKAMAAVTEEQLKRVEDQTRKSSHTILFIGRLTPAKRIDLVIELAGMLVGTFPDIRVFIIGDGSGRRQLESQAENMGLGKHIFFTGAVNDPEKLAGYMAQTDFTVLPGAVGLSLVHSMICGIPFVTLKDSPHSPEISYLKDHYNGFAASNLDQMADWITEQFHHPEKIEKMKLNCLEMIETHVNLDQMVSRFLEGIG